MSDWEEYCSLLFQARNRCPHATDGYGGQAEGCLNSCLGADFSHDGTSQDFQLSDTIQCRMNHAKLAIKEGALTNSQHYLPATIPGPHRCVEDAEVIKTSKLLELCKTYFYYIFSASLQEVGRSDNSKVSQKFLLSISYPIGLRVRLNVAYPHIDISSTSYKEVNCTLISSRKYRRADGTCNSLEVPSMAAAQTQHIHSFKPSLPYPKGNAEITTIAKIMKSPRVED